MKSYWLRKQVYRRQSVRGATNCPSLQNNLDEEKHNCCHQSVRFALLCLSLLSQGLILVDEIIFHMFIAKFTVLRLPFIFVERGVSSCMLVHLKMVEQETFLGEWQYHSFWGGCCLLHFSILRMEGVLSSLHKLCSLQGEKATPLVKKDKTITFLKEDRKFSNYPNHLLTFSQGVCFLLVLSMELHDMKKWQCEMLPMMNCNKLVIAYFWFCF